MWILSLLIAQIEKKPPGSVQEWLEAYRDNQLESFTTSTLEAFCKKEGLKVGGKKEKGDLVKSVKKCLQEKEEEEEEEGKKSKERRRKKKKKEGRRSPRQRRRPMTRLRPRKSPQKRSPSRRRTSVS